MRQVSELSDKNKMNDIFPDFTIEEFDAIEETHEFSERYRAAKKAALKAHRRSSARKFSFRAAAAAAAACILLPVGVYAAVTHSEFFRNVFGNSGRESVASHEETFDNGKGEEISYTFPEKEYVPVDEETAESLLGDKVSAEPLTVPINDHTLTILSAVRDENAMAMEFTLSCDTGVTALEWNDLSNETKGADISENATFHFIVDNAVENIYIDRENTTETSIHGYYYCLFREPLPEGKCPELNIVYADQPLQSLPDDVSPETLYVPINASETIPLTSFTSEEDGFLEVSAISMRIDMSRGFGLSEQDAYDADPETIAIEYTDGSVYQVLDKEGHIDNTSYLCGGLGEKQTDLAMNLNRLIDPAQVKSITVNGKVYTPAG